ncbi:centrosomal protein of 76 kDa-like [Sinocyclocheilus grahami]|uniref:centrosomal protein of 76 kDa-like n=1 Tax=Sinocyclocheilus grahami TaxID=75366 RepID=UPI0007AD24C3|nr:PREDICTED: centrosomal protein of 76 kDa-like [Sinocyclocheilus grahami]
MSLPPEKATELKQIIHDHLIKLYVTRNALRFVFRYDDDDDVVVFTEMTNNKQLKTTNISPLRRYLYLQVLGGKAFLEHLQEPEPLPGQVCSTFTLHLHFRNQRFRSKPVPCACEPDLQEGFLLEVHRDGPGDASKMADATTMLSICDPVHMVLIKTDTSGDTTLISSYFLDWRRVLGALNGKSSVSAELLGVGKQISLFLLGKKDLGLATVWDDHLSYLLSAALSAYELERCTGVSCGNEEFQDAVRRAVPDGHTFKGFPIHFLHRNARRAFATCLRSPFCDEIVCCRGDHVRLAVRDLGLATVWDDHLSYLLSAALSAYELERCTGVSCGNEEFQDAVRRAVPDGHTFKGFPIHFLHRNARRAFATCLRSPFCDEIVCCRGDHVRLAVRVRVFAYPESACAVWIMFACKYRSVL